MLSLKNVFNFFHDQGRVDNFASGISGLAVAGTTAAIIGFTTGNVVLAGVGLAVEMGTIALSTPLLAAGGDKFKHKVFIASTALALAGIFGLSAALPQADAKAPSVTAKATTERNLIMHRAV